MLGEVLNLLLQASTSTNHVPKRKCPPVAQSHPPSRSSSTCSSQISLCEECEEHASIVAIWRDKTRNELDEEARALRAGRAWAKMVNLENSESYLIESSPTNSNDSIGSSSASSTSNSLEVESILKAIT